jgi:hypothetical protein
MSELPSAIWCYCNRDNAQSACDHCKALIRHELWGITLNPGVSYACEIVADPSKLTVGDGLMLHSLGVIWEKKSSQGIGNQPNELYPLFSGGLRG